MSGQELIKENGRAITTIISISDIDLLNETSKVRSNFKGLIKG